MSEKDKLKIRELYFQNMRTITEICDYFKGKYTYNEIKAHVLSTCENCPQRRK